MLKWSLVFFLVSIVAAMLGFTNIAGSALDIARVLFFIFIFTALIFLVFGLLVFGAVRK